MGQRVAIRCDGNIKAVIDKPLLAWETMEFYFNFAGYKLVEAEDEQGRKFQYTECYWTEFQDWYNHGR